MPELFEISSASGTYSVRIHRGLIEEIATRYANAIFVIDEKLRDRLPESTARVVAIVASESSKSLESMPNYIAELRRLGANRDTRLVVIGGGTIQDVATFLASIYMRGLEWTYMPSTVLSMDDSCIGGKSSVNVLGIKNLVGNFHPPQDIVIDMDLVTTLGQDMVISGLFEASKICFAHGAARFEEYLRLSPETALTPESLQPIVSLSLQTKKWFIEIDEFDKKERLLLNFGHTFGHAVEAATNFSVTHGVAVGVGMLAACEYVTRNMRLSSAGHARVEQLRSHVIAMLGKGGSRVIAIAPDISMSKVCEMFNFDKKHSAADYRMVLPDVEGNLQLVIVPRTAATRIEVRQAFEDVFERLGWNFET